MILREEGENEGRRAGRKESKRIGGDGSENRKYQGWEKCCGKVGAQQEGLQDRIDH